MKDYPTIRQIVDLLLINGSLTEEPGLLHGKIGIAIFFFHYARFVKEALFEEYAMDLVWEVQKQLHINYCADYEKGIAGVGVGIDFLGKNGFLEVKEDTFEDLDERMYRAVMYDPYFDFSSYNGLVGYGKYWLARLSSQSRAKECLDKIVDYLIDSWPNLSEAERNDAHAFWVDCDRRTEYSVFLRNKLPLGLTQKKCLKHCVWNEASLALDKSLSSMGLLNGYAGLGMWRLTFLFKIDNCWTQLL